MCGVVDQKLKVVVYYSDDVPGSKIGLKDDGVKRYQTDIRHLLTPSSFNPNIFPNILVAVHDLDAEGKKMKVRKYGFSFSSRHKPKSPREGTKYAKKFRIV